MGLQYLKVIMLYLVSLYKMDSNTSEEQDTHLHHYVIPQYILPPKIQVKNSNNNNKKQADQRIQMSILTPLS